MGKKPSTRLDFPARPNHSFLESEKEDAVQCIFLFLLNYDIFYMISVQLLECFTPIM